MMSIDTSKKYPSPDLWALKSLLKTMGYDLTVHFSYKWQLSIVKRGWLLDELVLSIDISKNVLSTVVETYGGHKRGTNLFKITAEYLKLNQDEYTVKAESDTYTIANFEYDTVLF